MADEDTITPELYELVKRLTIAGYRIGLRPLGQVGDPIDYEVLVFVDGLTPASLKQLLEIIDHTPYDGAIDSDGWLSLRAP